MRRIKSPENKKFEDYPPLYSIHSHPPLPRKLYFKDKSVSESNWLGSGVLGTRGRTSTPTDPSSRAGRMPPPHRETSPADSGPHKYPAISSHPAEQNPSGDIPTAHLPLSLFLVTALSGDPSRPPCSSHPHPVVSGCRPPHAPPSLPDKQGLLPVGSTPHGAPSSAWQRGLTPSPSLSAGSSLHAAASRPGFSRQLLESRGWPSFLHVRSPSTALPGTGREVNAYLFTGERMSEQGNK